MTTATTEPLEDKKLKAQDKKKKKGGPEDLQANLNWNKKEIPEGMKMNSLRHLMSSLVRKETLDDVNYLVVPTALMCEGVHNKVLYTEDELKKFPQAWNGEPIVVWHPELFGKPVSANQPEILVQQTVGKLFYCGWDEDIKKLMGETWIEEEKCGKVSPEVIQMLEDDEPIEVSTGLYTEDEVVTGEWEGEEYERVAHNIRPDHLALLPGGEGACNWEDGGGMPRINQKKKEGVVDNNAVMKKEEGLFKRLLSTLGEALGLKVQEMSHSDIRSGLSDVVKDKLNPGINEYVYVSEVFDKTFIYTYDTNDGTKLYKQGYSIDANEEVQLSGDPVEVEEVIEYVPVTKTLEDDKTGEADNQGDTTTKGGTVMSRAEQVEALIAKSDWGEEDRESLMKMNDEQFSKAEAEKVKANADDGDDAGKGDKGKKKVTQNDDNADDGAGDGSGGDGDGDGDGDGKGDPKENQKPEEETLKSVLDNVKNPALKETLARSVARDKEVKDGMVEELKANEACKFSEEQLQAKSIEELETLLELSGSEKKASDYGQRVPAEVSTLADNGVPEMPALFANKDKDEKKD